MWYWPLLGIPFTSFYATGMTPPNPKSRWFQFSLRTLLLFMLLACIGLSWVAMKMQQSKRQREAEVAIEKLGGNVSWDPGSTPVSFGDEFFGTKMLVWLDDTQVTDAWLENIKKMPPIQCLYLEGTQVTDVGLEHLKGLSQLKGLELGYTQLTDAGLKFISKGYTNCDP